MNPNQDWTILEDKMSDWVDILFRNHIGHDVDHSEINQRALEVNNFAETVAPNYRNEPDSWSLLCNLIRGAKLTPINLEIRRIAEKYFTFDDIHVDNRPVTPYSIPQYLYQEDNPKNRQNLLLRLMKGHPELDHAWETQRTEQSRLAEEWEYTPLDDFLLAEELEIGKLRNLLMEMAAEFRPVFEEYFNENRAMVLSDNQGEPWEDFVTLYLNRWSAHIDQLVPAVNSIRTVRRIVDLMGFDEGAIKIDLEDRPRKVPGASAWDVRVPSDVRISVKPVGKVTDLAMVFHEMGHALHFASVDPNLPFPIRSGISSGVAETFSFWLDSLLGDPVYLEELEFNEQQTNEMVRYRKLIVATFATWLAVQSLCVIDFWTDGPLTLEQLGELLSFYMMRYMGLSVPVDAIRALPTFVRLLNFNTVGYPVAYARVGHLLDQLETKQRNWWHSSDAVDIVRRFMNGGRHPGFPQSMLEIGPFVKRYNST